MFCEELLPLEAFVPLEGGSTRASVQPRNAEALIDGPVCRESTEFFFVHSDYSSRNVAQGAATRE